MYSVAADIILLQMYLGTVQYVFSSCRHYTPADIVMVSLKSGQLITELFPDCVKVMLYE